MGPEVAQPHVMSSRNLSDWLPTQNISSSTIHTSGGDVGSHNRFEVVYQVNLNFLGDQCAAHGTKSQLEQWLQGMDKKSLSLSKESGEGRLECGPEFPSDGGCPFVNHHRYFPGAVTHVDREQIQAPRDNISRPTKNQTLPTSTLLTTVDRSTQHPAVDVIENLNVGVARRLRRCEPYTTLILHLGSRVGRMRLRLINAIRRHIPSPMNVKFSQSKATLFCYPETSYTDAQLSSLKGTLWTQIYPVLGVPATDIWRFKMFNSWPSIVIHKVPVNGSKRGGLLDFYAQAKSDLVQHGGMGGLQLDDIKSIRCLTKDEKIPTQGEVSIKVSFGYREDARHFLENGAYIFGTQCKASSYVPRKSRWRKSSRGHDNSEPTPRPWAFIQL